MSANLGKVQDPLRLGDSALRNVLGGWGGGGGKEMVVASWSLLRHRDWVFSRVIGDSHWGGLMKGDALRGEMGVLLLGARLGAKFAPRGPPMWRH